MPAKSVAQQRFMAMVHNYKQGDRKGAPPAVKKAASDMSDKSAKDFASTSHKGLPAKAGRNALSAIENGNGKVFMELLQARIKNRGGKK
ncbi:hypothetical protein [Methanoregula sp.]|uniref:hypothetical protein n=1 Tax=Methanoregula sp. TaxID=2052170 RepID=UPI003566B59B